ncbi:MAG: hypothetical protein AB7M05_08900 [Alphaproteobacteria bacterium]
MPASPAFKTSKFGLRSNTITFESPLSGSVQTLEMPGARWTASYELPPMKRATAAAWQAFFVRLRGQAGRFYGYDPDARAPQGVATGTPLVNGASQTGSSLITDGWSVSVTGILKAGDYVAFDTGVTSRELHMVVEDVNSNASGEATLSIEPPIRISPADNAPIILSSASCVMMLATPESAWDANEMSVYGIAFEAVEAFAQ